MYKMMKEIKHKNVEKGTKKRKKKISCIHLVEGLQEQQSKSTNTGNTTGDASSVTCTSSNACCDGA